MDDRGDAAAASAFFGFPIASEMYEYNSFDTEYKWVWYGEI
jgi:hypothetical protein